MITFVNNDNDECPIGDLNVIRPLPPTPTRALPGTQEKVTVMAWRNSNGFALFHPKDAKWPDGEANQRREMRRDFDNMPIHFDEQPDLRSLLQRLVDSIGEGCVEG